MGYVGYMGWFYLTNKSLGISINNGGLMAWCWGFDHQNMGTILAIMGINHQQMGFTTWVCSEMLLSGKFTCWPRKEPFFRGFTNLPTPSCQGLCEFTGGYIWPKLLPSVDGKNSSSHGMCPVVFHLWWVDVDPILKTPTRWCPPPVINWL